MQIIHQVSIGPEICNKGSYYDQFVQNKWFTVEGASSIEIPTKNGHKENTGSTAELLKLKRLHFVQNGYKKKWLFVMLDTYIPLTIDDVSN